MTSYLSRAGVDVKLLVNQDSIFLAYANALKKVNPDPDDIIILCHDDINITTDPIIFKSLILEKFALKATGFLGVAGTRKLSESAVWWDLNLWKQQFHSGYALHGDNLADGDPSYYGKYGQVVALDGLFLVAQAKTLQKIDMKKPKSFSGKWDFYDIWYTIQAHKAGLKNYTIPVVLLHNSRGELAGRDSWHKNREAFIKKYKASFPIEV